MATQASDSIRQQSRASAGDDLAVIAQRAQSFTNASGAAIAIGEGSMDEIVCRARSGSSAPDVGVALRVQGSFTGLCIQTGKELRCDDAETDTRVDMSAIRALGIRSMVVTPIREEGKVVGVLAVFAPTPHAFTITHVAVLKTMADQISVLLQKGRRTKDAPRMERMEAPAPVAVPTKPPVAVPLPPPVVIKPAMPPVSMKPVSMSSASAATAPAPVRTNTPVPAPKIEMQPVSLAADIAAPVPFPRREERREEKREFKPEPAPASKVSFGTLDAVAGEPRKSSGSKMIVVSALVVVVIAAGGGWYFFKTHRSSTSTSTQVAQQQQNPGPPAPAAAQNPPVTSVAPPVTTPANTITSTNAANTKASAPERAENKRNDSKKREQEAEPPAPTTVALDSGPSKIARSAPVDQSPEVSPTLGVAGGSSSGLASLARPDADSKPSMLAQSDLVNSKAIHTVPAVYPEMAKSRRISGTVIVKVTVTKDGKTRNPVFLSGPVIFRDAAFDAVKQWLFKPAELNGQPIEQDTEIRVIFHP